MASLKTCLGRHGYDDGQRLSLFRTGVFLCPSVDVGVMARVVQSRTSLGIDLVSSWLVHGVENRTSLEPRNPYRRGSRVIFRRLSLDYEGSEGTTCAI